MDNDNVIYYNDYYGVMYIYICEIGFENECLNESSNT